MLYKILEYPHQGLNNKSTLVTHFNTQLLTTIDNLYETMYASGGIGLAATQVNIHQRIFVMDLSEDRSAPECFINAKIIDYSGKVIDQEGCLSFPGLSIDVPRFESITIQANNSLGKSVELTANGLKARCIQHEMDHLDGITFISRLSGLKRRRALKALALLKEEKKLNAAKK